MAHENAISSHSFGPIRTVPAANRSLVLAAKTILPLFQIFALKQNGGHLRELGYRNAAANRLRGRPKFFSRTRGRPGVSAGSDEPLGDFMRQVVRARKSYIRSLNTISYRGAANK